MGRWTDMLERAAQLARVAPESGEFLNRSEVIETLIREFDASPPAALQAAGRGATARRKAMGIVVRGQQRNVDFPGYGGRPRKEEEPMANQPDLDVWNDALGLMTISQVARLLNVSDETVRKWTEAGEIPSVNLGQRGGAGRSSMPRYKRSAIKRWLEEREAGGRS